MPILNFILQSFVLSGTALTIEHVDHIIKSEFQKLFWEVTMRHTKCTFLLICLFMLVFFPSVNASEGEGTTITCYVADPPDYEYVGELEVFNIAEATSTCNNVYSSCQGNCVGCYINQESFETCIDKNGTYFERE